MTFRFPGRRSLIAALTVVTAMNATPSQAAPADDAREILRLAVTAPNVAKYLKLGEAGAPLRVANATAVDFGPASFAIEGHPVVMVPREAADRSTVEIVSAELRPNDASLTFRYRRQGIQVTGAFTKTGNTWTAQSVKLVER